MDYRKKRIGTKRLSAILLIFCLTLMAAPALYAQEYKLGDIPLHPEIYKKYQKAWPMEMEEVLPSAYDARDEGFVTSAKNQGSCGSCWAFASAGAMESHLLKAYQAGPEDLSEQQQVSCNTSMWGCDGGSSSAIKYWEQKGPLDEACFPYTASDSTPCDESNCTQLGYRVIDWHTVSTTDFKNSLYTYGPSYWRFDVYTDFDTFWTEGTPGQVYTNQPGSTYRGGHAVLLIGWDDSKGAYLCKNSWGSEGPNDDGTFWISYSGHFYDLGFGMANFSLISLTCSVDSDCDDGIFCNGAETCAGGACEEGTPPCPDDGIFCNGSERCDEQKEECTHSGDPCSPDTFCGEGQDSYICCDGDGICDESEDCNSCVDCISGRGGTCDNCFKGRCDGICNYQKEGPNCSDCAPSYCCGDGVCEMEETVENCKVDCGCKSDADCNDNENCTYDDTCNESTGQCINTWPDCNPKKSDGCCGPDCNADNDSDCSECQPKDSDCSSDIQCCSNRCHTKKMVCL